MTKKLDVGIVHEQNGLITKKDASDKVTFLKSGAVVQAGDILELMSGKASIQMLYGTTVDLPLGKPVVVDASQSILVEPEPHIADFLTDSVNKGLDNALVMSVLQTVGVNQALLEEGASAFIEDEIANKKRSGSEDIPLDVVIASMEESRSHYHNPMLTAITPDTNLTSKTVSLNLASNIERILEENVLDGDYLLKETPLDHANFSNLHIPVHEVEFHNTIVQYVPMETIFIVDALEGKSEFLLQVSVASLGFIDGDQLMLVNKNGVQFDINNHVVSVDTEPVLQFNIIQNGYDIDYDFSAISSHTILAKTYERVLQCIAFKPLAAPLSQGLTRTISIQTIDDTGMSNHTVIQFNVEVNAK